MASTISVGSVTMSRAQLHAAADVTAIDLIARDLRRVAVWARPSMSTVIAIVGAMRAGVEAVPVPPDSGQQELRHILSDARPHAWLGEAPEVTDVPTIAVDLDAATEAGAAEQAAQPGDRTALILYTSGTTGLPKGVPITHGAIRTCLDGLIDAWRWTADDSLAHGLPLFHVHGLVLGVLGPLRAGSGLVHVGRPTPEAYAAANASMYFGVPTVWSRVAESPDEARALSSARLLVSGSAALPVPVWERLRALTGHEVVERYGMTETLITVATRADGPARPGWVGLPLPGVETRLVSEDGAQVRHDGESVGRLEVRGATVFGGYLDRPDADAESFTADGWFRTGDVALVAPDGNHRIVGRESVDLIKSGGWRIGAGEIEATLLGHPRVAECAVIGSPDDDLGQRVVAHVVVRDGTGDDELADELIAYVGRELSAHKRPRQIVWATSLPRNEMGKVQKQRLG